MKTYTVKSPVKYGGKLHPIGATVGMTDEDAKRAIAKGSVELLDPRAKVEAINEAIKASALLVAAGALTIDQAAEQIAAQASGTVASQIRAALQDAVDAQIQRAADEDARKRKEQEEAGARKATEESAARTDTVATGQADAQSAAGERAAARERDKKAKK